MACKGGTLKSGTDNYYPNAYYKVGDLFLTTRNENPSLRFGGTWELFGKGKTLVCVDENDVDFKTVKQTGGEKTHTLTYDELPKMRYFTGDLDIPGYYDNDVNSAINTGTHYGLKYPYIGKNQAHNNLQPYITCYIWIRTE